MENSEVKVPHHDKSECVRVAVNIRPLIQSELLLGCSDCVTVTPGEPQVQIGAHTFTYDYVYGNSGCPSSALYDDCVAPLIDAIFHGYNATVLAYGQTGSGKTYTMGTNYTGEANSGGIIPKVMEAIFKKVDEIQDTEFLIRVSFIEIFKEEVFDLLDASTHAWRSDGPSLAKPAGPSRAPIQIRETAAGGITLAGVTEAEVNSKEEMASYLARGSISRATGSTNMNSQSSRSHAIFTINIEQKKNAKRHGSQGMDNETCDDIVFAKFHLVDLAGSERAKRTGADGLRLKEGIHINKGLLALGNVISALGDEKKRKEGGHVPYRDSKLTRLLQVSAVLGFVSIMVCNLARSRENIGLGPFPRNEKAEMSQDSLGGNSKTVMIACVSPADTNAEETINTLKYANRARNIQNKAVVNHDPMTAQMQRMRSQLEQLQSELLYFRNGGAPLEELQLLRHRISLLEASNAELHQELRQRQMTCEHLSQRALDAQIERDELILKIESFRNGKPWNEIDNFSDKKQSKDAFLPTMHSFSSSSNGKSADGSAEVESDEKEREHSTLQEKFGSELQELEKQLEQKEAEMERFSKGDTSVLKQHYEKKILELEHEKKTLQIEIEDLRSNLANISSASGDDAQKLKEAYLQKLNILEAQVSDLKRKQEAQSQLLRQKQKSDDAAKRLQDEIQRIKSQKVHLQHKMKQESEQFRSWKASREKEVLQVHTNPAPGSNPGPLPPQPSPVSNSNPPSGGFVHPSSLGLGRLQGRSPSVDLFKVLQRKTEEASLATKRLKELLEAKKVSSRDNSGMGNANGPGMQALMQTIEHELEVTLRVHEVRSKYERQLEARAAMASELMKLKDDAEALRKNTSDCAQTMSPSARNSRISALENMLATSSNTLVSMASHLSEAEERERLFSGKNRWNQVRSLAEAKNLLNYLFNIATSSRCQLLDRDAMCLEKDSTIKELTEKVVRLTSLLRQSEAQKIEIQQKFQAPRRSQFLHGTGYSFDILEDMDTSDSDSDIAELEVDDEDWVESGKKLAKRRSKGANRSEKAASTGAHSQEEKLEVLADALQMEGKPDSERCCSCSKSSTCKTKKCECRASNNMCGRSCGCIPFKCANRGDNVDKEISETRVDHSSVDLEMTDKSTELAAHGAMLLQSAFFENAASVDEDVQQRRPLSDIGNTVVLISSHPHRELFLFPVIMKPTASKPNRRKNWRKSVVQLVPSATVPPTQSEINHDEPPKTREDMVLKLPRAMGSQALNSQPLGDRNSIMADESAGNKDVGAGIIPPKSPVRLPRATNEKENKMI
ncbi:hypothetical protein Taro_019809 [Colocasia esculenta]|uniref:Kinesin motor domain-containing protein n=1 Tax=Colocasia esculenta TaxID=4460 RepID=A0A843UUG9_COLES|nr:hypothetical protein [Colocasia esculenta]